LIDKILPYLTYSSEYPLLFTQLYFWIFLAIVLVGYSFLDKTTTSRNAYLFGVSLFFYYKTSGFYFVILLVSTLADFIIGNFIYSSKTGWRKKSWLALSIFINLFILVYFKYAYFFADFFTQVTGIEVTVYNYFSFQFNNIVGTNFVWEKILLPVGISFFTFQTMSYAIDIYRGHIKPVKNVLDFGFYVSFFPQLVAGPIVRASDFVPQLYQKYSVTKEQFGIGLFWILNGLLKKLFLADYIAINFIDRVFSNPGSYTGFENMMALFGYTLQVYADFSGYTDIAIGVALWMGFTLPVNFNSPYKATSVGEFWKRWHISLSTWLKDYLYIPMGGNRSGSLFSNIMIGVIILFVSLLAASWWVPIGFVVVSALFFLIGKVLPKFKSWVNTNVNLMLTMLIGGLWHGASWNFVMWGGLNGIGLVVYKLWKKVSPWEDRSKWYNRAIGIFITLVFITFTRTWFRGETWESSLLMLEQIAFKFQGHLMWDILVGYKNVFIVMLLGFVIHWLPVPTKDSYRNWFVRTPIFVKALISLVAVIFIYQILSADLQPFIYFDF
jgi:D-alanyl-lipoteichoic acid acyltransferase DltB (MBOAT superfamily)